MPWTRFDETPIGSLVNGGFYLVYVPGRLEQTKCDPDISVGRYSYDQYGYGGDNPSHSFTLDRGIMEPTHWAELPEPPK